LLRAKERSSAPRQNSAAGDTERGIWGQRILGFLLGVDLDDGGRLLARGQRPVTTPATTPSRTLCHCGHGRRPSRSTGQREGHPLADLCARHGASPVGRDFVQWARGRAQASWRAGRWRGTPSPGWAPARSRIGAVRLQHPDGAGRACGRRVKKCSGLSRRRSDGTRGPRGRGADAATHVQQL